MTLAAARWRRFSRAQANLLSRTIALPIIVGATGLKGARLASRGTTPELRRTLAVGIGASFVSTLASQRLIGLVERDRALWPYAAYRAALAAVVLGKLRREALIQILDKFGVGLESGYNSKILDKLGIDLELHVYVEPAPTIERADRADSTPRDLIDALRRLPATTAAKPLPPLGQAAAPAAPGGTEQRAVVAEAEAGPPDGDAAPAAGRTRTAAPFGYTLPDLVLRPLHHIDQRGGGEVAMDEVVTSEQRGGQALPRQLADGGGDPLQPARGGDDLAGRGQGAAAQRAGSPATAASG